MRRLFIIVLLVLLVIGAVLGVYLLFFSNNGLQVSTETPGGAFGTSGDYEGSLEENAPVVGEVMVDAGEEVAPRLVKITDGPVAFGSVAFPTTINVETRTASGTATTTQGEDTEIRFIERASGNVYGYAAGKHTLTRLTNRTLPGVYEASWLSDGSMAFVRFLSDDGDGNDILETYALTVNDQEGGGYFLEPGLSDVVVRGTTTLATLLPSSSGSITTVAKVNGEDPTTLFTSSLSRLRLVLSGNEYVAYTKPSASIPGYGFLIGSTGTFERVLGPQRGLMLLPSPSGKNIFYSYLSGSTLRAELLETSSRVSTVIPLGAMAEKCVWAKDETSMYCAVPRSISGIIPDDWYQGATLFSDRIWKIDLTSRVASLLVDPGTAADLAIDAVNLSIDTREDVLIFTNKSDGSLWVYDL